MADNLLRQMACIRQNVCTSLRRAFPVAYAWRALLHTSKRMHFIEEPRTRSALSAPGLAYVKTYALH